MFLLFTFLLFYFFTRGGREGGVLRRPFLGPTPTPAQKSAAESYVNSLTEQNSYDNPIVTEISELSIFYEAEEYHHDYFSKNPSNPYCIFNTLPKMIKAREIFSDMSSPGD